MAQLEYRGYERLMKITKKQILIIYVITILSISFAKDYQKILNNSWDHYKKQKIAINGRPVADIDYRDLSRGSYGKELSFSETVSYVLYRAVLMNDKETFDKVWLWSYHNMMRKNIPRVFNWEESRWETIPVSKKDNLFAWRFTPNIKNTNIGGIIYVPDSSQPIQGWRDGLEVAPDGDELIAGSLIMAHNRWGSGEDVYNYQSIAKDIVLDIWNKCVYKSGTDMLEDFENSGAADRWFSYNRGGMFMKKLEKDKGNSFLSIDTFNTDYYGIGKYLGKLDMSQVKGISFQTKWNRGLKLVLEDVTGKKVIYSRHYSYKDELSLVEIYFDNRENINFDWSQVKSLMFQPIDDYFAIDDVKLIQEENLTAQKYHLLSNAKGDPWINISYYMPFLYEAFAIIDPLNNWKQLAKDCLLHIKQSKTLTLSNQKGDVFKGNGALVPDWCMLDNKGNLVDLPWATDGEIDDYLSGWDAFRTWYFLAMTKEVVKESNIIELLKGKTYEFFKKKYKEDKVLLNGYSIDGRVSQIRGLQYEYPSSYGVYLAFFTAVEDKNMEYAMLDKLNDMYRSSGYWGDNPKDYYKQNWAWFGLEFYINKGKNVAKYLGITE
jgi:endo-1,4-beta-D-glucanase Y